MTGFHFTSLIKSLCACVWRRAAGKQEMAATNTLVKVLSTKHAVVPLLQVIRLQTHQPRCFNTFYQFLARLNQVIKEWSHESGYISDIQWLDLDLKYVLNSVLIGLYSGRLLIIQLWKAKSCITAKLKHLIRVPCGWEVVFGQQEHLISEWKYLTFLKNWVLRP